MIEPDPPPIRLVAVTEKSKVPSLEAEQKVPSLSRLRRPNSRQKH